MNERSVSDGKSVETWTPEKRVAEIFQQRGYTRVQVVHWCTKTPKWSTSSYRIGLLRASITGGIKIFISVGPTILPSIGRETKQIDFVMAARCSNYYGFDFIDGTTKNNRSPFTTSASLVVSLSLSLSLFHSLFLFLCSSRRGLIDSYLIPVVVEFLLLFRHTRSGGRENTEQERKKCLKRRTTNG